MITYSAGILLPKMPKAIGSKLLYAIFAWYFASNLQVAHFSTVQRSRLPAPASCHHRPLSCSRQAVVVQAAETMGWVQKVPALSQEGHQGVFACRRGAELLPLGRGLGRFN